ncbi:unnamed protein product [Ilex paraguariensis]|uniref:Protein kinase domain-containing protein n=1 Tax=Ilex paraguariensis TaxID=185542 RepID=A0ABC8U8U9_9AQUA
MTSEVPNTSGQQHNNDSANVVPSDEFYGNERAHNISIQTGEEFSAEFLRDRVTPRRVPTVTDMDQQQQKKVGFSVVRNHQLVYEDLTGLRGIRRRDFDSGTDFTDYSPGKGPELENRSYWDVVNRYQREYSAGGHQPGRVSNERNSDRATSSPTCPPMHASDSPHSYQPYNHAPGVSDGSFTGKMKFLCSFGGKILPRPNDGKLRYVGGETRIISIRKNLTYSELVKKTSAICNLPQTIKYQLPGEDLDALISVSSDEDLHHMIDEYHDLERGSQRLRIFLVSCSESESPSSYEAKTVQPSDADYQYVVAVNGMLDPSPRRSSSRESLASQASQWGNALDYSPTLQRDSPTYFHPLETRNGGSSANLMLMLSNPTAQLFNTPQVQARSCHDDIDQLAYVDANSYYYNHPLDAVPVRNYYHQNKHLVASNQTHEVRSDNRSLSKDFVSSPLYGHTDVYLERPELNEIALHSEKLPSSQDTIVRMPRSDVTVGSHLRMSNTLSDSQQHEEQSNYPLKEGMELSPLCFAAEQSPSLMMSTSSKEWLLPKKEMTDETHQVAMNENQPTLKAPDLNMEYIEWGQDMIKCMEKEDACLGQDRADHEGNGNIASQGNTMEYKMNSPIVNCYPDPKLEVHNVPREAQVAGVIHHALTAADLETTSNVFVENPGDYQLIPSAPEFLVKNQKATKDQQHFVTGTISSDVIPHRSLRLKPFAYQGIEGEEHMLSSLVNSISFPRDESSSSLNLNDSIVTDFCLLNPATDAALSSEVSLHEEDKMNDYGKSVEKEGPEGKACEVSKFGDAIFFQSHPSINHKDSTVPELTVIVEDVTHRMPTGVPSVSTVVPHVEDEPSDGVPSPRETETESITPESDCEDAKVEGNDNDESISDAAIIEMEAGIYGLQIIKNADIEELQELGSGTFGTVYHGKWRGTDVAIKRIKKSCFAGRSSEQERLTKDFWREAQILSKLHHPNVVALYGVVPDGPGGTFATVTEFMVNGSLRHVLLKKDRALDRRKKVIIALDAAFGMEYLHLKNIVHFDLKCDNLLVNMGDRQRPICKVGDFGLSRIKRNTLVSGGVRGTLPWMAPELLNGNSSRVSEKVRTKLLFYLPCILDFRGTWKME